MSQRRAGVEALLQLVYKLLVAIIVAMAAGNECNDCKLFYFCVCIYLVTFLHPTLDCKSITWLIKYLQYFV